MNTGNQKNTDHFHVGREPETSCVSMPTYNSLKCVRSLSINNPNRKGKKIKWCVVNGPYDVYIRPTMIMEMTQAFFKKWRVRKHPNPLSLSNCYTSTNKKQNTLGLSVNSCLIFMMASWKSFAGPDLNIPHLQCFFFLIFWYPWNEISVQLLSYLTCTEALYMMIAKSGV